MVNFAQSNPQALIWSLIKVVKQLNSQTFGTLIFWAAKESSADENEQALRWPMHEKRMTEKWFNSCYTSSIKLDMHSFTIAPFAWWLYKVTRLVIYIIHDNDPRVHMWYKDRVNMYICNCYIKVSSHIKNKFTIRQLGTNIESASLPICKCFYQWISW